MIYKTCATFPLDGGKVAAYAVGAMAVVAHATVTLRTVGENGLAARPLPPRRHLCEGGDESLYD